MTTTTSPRSISAPDTAKLIRKALKAKFPGHRFSVRTSTYSMGASITASWIDGPTQDQVNDVIGEFAGSTFDGMTDSKNYHTSNLKGEQVRYGADFVFTRREATVKTAELMQVAVAMAAGCAYDDSKAVEVRIIGGRACPCTHAHEYMNSLARCLFGVTEVQHTKEKLEWRCF